MKVSALCLLMFVSSQVQALVIFLNGTSSAGKTSIARELYQIFDGSYQIFSIDEYLSFKLLYEAVQKAVEENQNIIIDTVIINPAVCEQNFLFLCQKEVFFVLVHCSLPDLCDHVKKRNQLSNVREHRNLYAILKQHFMYVYKRALVQDVVLDEISLQKFLTVLETIDSEQKRLELVKKFNEEYAVRDALRYTSRFDYDCIVNTGKYSSKECALQIVEKINTGQAFDSFVKNFVEV